MATSTTLGISLAQYQPSPINPVRDFAAVGQVGSVNFFLIAHRASRAHGARDGRRDQREPGKVQLRVGRKRQPASPLHGDARGEQRLSIQHVPYKGTAAAITDLLTNAIQLMFCDATIALPNIHAGKVVALGTSAAKPTQLAAGVPPIAATLPGFDWQAWQGIVAPSATPKDVIARLSTEMMKLQDNAEFRAQLVKFGMEPSPPQTPEQFAAVIVAEQPRWAKAIRESGAKVD